MLTLVQHVKTCLAGIHDMHMLGGLYEVQKYDPIAQEIMPSGWLKPAGN